MKRRSAKAVRIPSARSDDQPATRKMLGLVRRELIQRMDAGFHRMEARFADIEARFTGIDGRFVSIDARFVNIDARFVNIDARFVNIDARFERIEARFSNLEASNARMELLLEEQNHNNRYVLEMLQGLYQRQTRLEDRMDARGL